MLRRLLSRTTRLAIQLLYLLLTDTFLLVSSVLVVVTTVDSTDSMLDPRSSVDVELRRSASDNLRSLLEERRCSGLLRRSMLAVRLNVDGFDSAVVVLYGGELDLTSRPCSSVGESFSSAIRGSISPGASVKLICCGVGGGGLITIMLW